MKKYLDSKVLCAVLILVGATSFSGISAVHAEENAFARGKVHCYPINLTGGAIQPLPTPYLEYVVPPEDSNNDGWYETVIKVKIDDPSIRHSPAAARFFVKYDGPPTGWTVNIGDSQSNNGGSGDAADQSNDAELQMGGEFNDEFDDLWIFGHDGVSVERGDAKMAQAFSHVKDGETTVFTISNERVEYKNMDYPIIGEVRSPWLYALDGQADTEGPVNHDIYASFNRVISSAYRIGTGVGKVKVCLIPHSKFHIN
jgi:hypothetical protein